MLNTRWFAVTLATVLAACTSSEQISYSVVKGTVAIDARGVPSPNNLYPWVRAAPGEVIVSNACGFVTAQYRTATLHDYLFSPTGVHWSVIPYQVQIGEWCSIRPVVIDGDTLIRYRLWKGRHYSLGAAPILNDDAGGPFVENETFIAEYEAGLERDPLLPEQKRLFLRDVSDPR
jgi:hypothetical protein